MPECRCAIQRSAKCALTCHISVDRFRACVKKVAIGGEKACEQQSSSYITWVSERVFMLHIARCQNSDSWSPCIDSGSKLMCTYCQVHSMRSKVYNLQTQRYYRDLVISEFWYYSGCKMSWSNHTQATGRRIVSSKKNREKDLLVLPLPLRKLLPVSLQIIADAANELEYLDVILTGWNSAPLDSRKNVCIQ